MNAKQQAACANLLNSKIKMCFKRVDERLKKLVLNAMQCKKGKKIAYLFSLILMDCVLIVSNFNNSSSGYNFEKY